MARAGDASRRDARIGHDPPARMGLYERVVFNAAMELVLGRASIRAERTAALAPARGAILEVGIGTGLNVPCYPEHVREVTALQLDSRRDPRLEHRTMARGLRVDVVTGDAQRMPLPDASFDTIVCTFLLCSIRDPAAALSEFNRVLRPDGSLLFLEHVGSAARATRTLQRILDPLHVLAACGCSLRRDTAAAIGANGFAIAELVDRDVGGVPWPYRRIIRGVATPTRW